MIQGITCRGTWRWFPESLSSIWWMISRRTENRISNGPNPWLTGRSHECTWSTSYPLKSTPHGSLLLLLFICFNLSQSNANSNLHELDSNTTISVHQVALDCSRILGQLTSCLTADASSCKKHRLKASSSHPKSTSNRTIALQSSSYPEPIGTSLPSSIYITSSLPRCPSRYRGWRSVRDEQNRELFFWSQGPLAASQFLILLIH